MLQAKLHCVTVTDTRLDYEGSCEIDEDLLVAAGMLPNQYIEVYNVANGNRFSTYIIKGPRGERRISLNGAAARLAVQGDKIIVCAYSSYDENEIRHHAPTIVLVDDDNNVSNIADKT
jgi:aspartate 1-decarboxylase